MTRYFNTEGVCRPNVHYMVRLEDRLAQIRKQFVDRGKYFVINRGRQYGKTTTLMLLREYLKDEYIVGNSRTVHILAITQVYGLFILL